MDWISDGSPELALGRIHIVNYSDQQAEIDVTITKDGEETHHERHPISGYEESDDQPRTGAVTIVEDWMGDPAEYELQVEVIGSDIESSQTTESLRERIEEGGADDIPDGACFEFSVRVGEPTFGGELDTVTIGTERIQTDSPGLASSCTVPEE